MCRYVKSFIGFDESFLSEIKQGSAQRNQIIGNKMQLGWDSFALLKKEESGFRIKNWVTVSEKTSCKIPDTYNPIVTSFSTRLVQTCTVVIISNLDDSLFIIMHIDNSQICKIKDHLGKFDLSAGKIFISRISGADTDDSENGTKQEAGFSEFLSWKFKPKCLAETMRGNTSNPSDMFMHNHVAMGSDLNLFGDFAVSQSAEKGGFSLEWKKMLPDENIQPLHSMVMKK